MLCLHFEPLLARYADGTLGARETAGVEAHLARCPACSDLLIELRSLDRILAATPAAEPAGNFTDRVMATVGRVPHPRRRVASWWGILASYVIFAWLTIAAFLVIGGAAARDALVTLVAIASHAADLALMLAGASARLAGTRVYELVAAMSVLLALDGLALTGTIVLYASLRQRARLRSSPGS